MLVTAALKPVPALVLPEGKVVTAEVGEELVEFVFELEHAEAARATDANSATPPNSL
ncbi:hypothetical protein [Catenulispora pinisilvae]|uniref:hypothetical protein n=1 Tax=Catenulispora pinisilvae TaxID=2705253 RepID=UPI0018918D1C|nr:hypothetical protein [Catenulispora pinisilvae]